METRDTIKTDEDVLAELAGEQADTVDESDEALTFEVLASRCPVAT